ncbi:MAG: amidase family protein [Burkholderiaceae bacterium]
MPSAAALPWPATQAFPTEIAGQAVGPRGHAVFTGWVNAAGLPAMSLPVESSSSGLPIGLQLVGPYGADDTLFDLAQALESSLHQTPPLAVDLRFRAAHGLGQYRQTPPYRIARLRPQNPHPGAGGQHRASHQCAKTAAGMAQPMGQQPGGIAHGMGTRTEPPRLAHPPAPGNAAAPNRPRKGHPVAQRQRTVRLQIGQLGVGRGAHALSPARIHHLDGHGHGVHQISQTRCSQALGHLHIHRSPQAQRNLRFDAAQGKGPARQVGRAVQHPRRRQRCVGQQGIPRCTTRFPVARRAVGEPAEMVGHARLHAVGGLCREFGDRRRKAQMPARLPGGHQCATTSATPPPACASSTAMPTPRCPICTTFPFIPRP